MAVLTHTGPANLSYHRVTLSGWQQRLSHSQASYWAAGTPPKWLDATFTDRPLPAYIAIVILMLDVGSRKSIRNKELNTTWSRHLYLLLGIVLAHAGMVLGIYPSALWLTDPVTVDFIYT
ncbi:hypothetical protein H109_00255 [Trichophyton interdigitale MR816]|uniref:Uncharacterized protein n=1 Tax=Trichophyton interdigitale (strain MR816) TaxID=1215338 RepID=A0A059JJI7_TRIIM|nr:hypothetical protein H101_03841 [Trichophyton interdigitale H6]KDB27959.1 hypothetical protein H109_00255 [Trichophyton interdigitale MR816]